jgi:hypothetical protein
VTVFTSAGDAPLKRLRDPDVWAGLVTPCPRHAHWLDDEPISGVIAMAGVTDRYRRFTVDNHPVATGIAPARIAEIEALRNGLEPAPRSDSSALLREALLAALPRDPDAFRAFLASRCCLTPLRETFANRQFVERMLEFGRDREPRRSGSPDRAQLLQLLDDLALRTPTRRSNRNRSTRPSPSRGCSHSPAPTATVSLHPNRSSNAASLA